MYAQLSELGAAINSLGKQYEPNSWAFHLVKLQTLDELQNFDQQLTDL
jgi:hypothetical protein